jgi:carbonic anhydrase
MAGDLVPMRTLLRHEVPAAVVVFGVALLPALGITAASGAPLLAGLVVAVVAGIVAGVLSGAPLRVSGPAAGLTVIVAGTVTELSWTQTTVVVALAGLVQIVLGVSRLGRVALGLSPVVVHGMLAGIGVVLVLSQLRIVLGDESRNSAGWSARNLMDRPALLGGSIGLGVLTIVIMLIWPRFVRTSLLPGALIAVAVATAVAAGAGLDVPRLDLPDRPLEELASPRWPDAPPLEIAGIVLTIGLVASVESLLSVVVVDKLREGRPATTGTVPGGGAWAATVLRGCWIGFCVLLTGGLLAWIPLAAPAGVLVVVGLRLVGLARIKVYARHRELPTYLITGFGVIFTGLLTGVALGMATAVLFMLARLARCEVHRSAPAPGHWLVVITGTLAFIGSGRVRRELAAVPAGESVELEMHLDYLDHSAYRTIQDWRETYERGGGRVHMEEVHDSWFHRATSGRLGGARSHAGRVPRFLGSWSQWNSLLERRLDLHEHRRDAMAAGIDEFERSVAPLVRAHLADLARDGQKPEQLFITCADSRLVPNMITTSGPGDLFCLRNVGNIVPAHGTGDCSVGAGIEYAVEVLGVATITVCGHSDCGAVRAMMAGAAGSASALGGWLGSAGIVLTGREHEVECIAANVEQQLANLRTYPSVRRAVDEGRLELGGLYFDLAEARMYTVAGGVRSPVSAP